MHKSVVLLLMVLLAGCACSSKLAYHSTNVIKHDIGSVVKIYISYTTKDKITLAIRQKRYVGTGFSIENTDTATLILTNQHICSMKDQAEYTLTLQSGKTVKAIYIRSDPYADVCLLATRAYVPPLKLAAQNASQGERIVVIGGPAGAYPMVVDGIVSGYYNMDMKAEPDDDGEFEVHFRCQVMSAPIYGGNSGSPVLNANSEAVGIVFAANRKQEHISYMVPVSEIHRFLDNSEYVYIN